MTIAPKFYLLRYRFFILLHCIPWKGSAAFLINIVKWLRFTNFPKSYSLRKLILPGAAAQIFVGLQLGLIFAWLATIGSEFLLASYGNGLGNIVIQGRQAFDVPLIIFGMLLIGLVGVLLNATLLWFERKLLRWQQPI